MSLEAKVRRLVFFPLLCFLSHDPGWSTDSSCVYVPCQCRCELICFMLNPEAKINLVKGIYFHTW